MQWNYRKSTRNFGLLYENLRRIIFLNQILEKAHDNINIYYPNSLKCEEIRIIKAKHF